MTCNLGACNETWKQKWPNLPVIILSMREPRTICLHLQLFLLSSSILKWICHCWKYRSNSNIGPPHTESNDTPNSCVAISEHVAKRESRNAYCKHFVYPGAKIISICLPFSSFFYIESWNWIKVCRRRWMGSCGFISSGRTRREHKKQLKNLIFPTSLSLRLH